MDFEKMSKILDSDQEKSLNRIEWFLNVSDREIDAIESLFTRLINLDPGKIKIHQNNKELVIFKIKQIFQIIHSLDENIFNSSFDYYKQYFGPFKKRNNFLAIRELTVSYQFENFLTQLMTLLDVFVNYLGDAKLNNICFLRSFSDISRRVECIKEGKTKSARYQNSKDKIALLKRDKTLQHFFKNYDAFFNLKNYRDYIVHRGIIEQEKTISKGDGKYLQYEYWIPKLSRIKKEYFISETEKYRLDFFCRVRFIETLFSIKKTLQEMIDPSLIKNLKKEFKTINSEKTSLVLQYLGRKITWNDKSYLKKEDLAKILKKEGYSLSDLIIDRVDTERQNKGLKSYDNKDMSFILERIIYKPLRYMGVNRIKQVYDRDWKPESKIRLEDRYGITDESFIPNDLKNVSGETNKIFDLFLKLGIAIKVQVNGAEKFVFIDEKLQRFIATLAGMNSYKWTFIQYPLMKDFRGIKPAEKYILTSLNRLNFENSILKDTKERNKGQDDYKEFKKRQGAWKKFKIKNKIDIKSFKKNSLNYEEIQKNWNSGLMKEIRTNWVKEYESEKFIDLIDKDGKRSGVIEPLDYLHQLNTDFKVWKAEYDEKKLGEIKKLCNKVFTRKKEHFLDLQKKFISRSRKDYLKMLNQNKKDLAADKKEYFYLKGALKLICPDFYTDDVDVY